MKIKINNMEAELEYRRVKNINLYVQPPDGHILITAPPTVSRRQIEAFVTAKQAWIRNAKQRIIQSQSSIGRPEEITERDMARLQGWIRVYSQKWEAVLKVHCERWTIRYMKTRWGSCSVQKRTIRINSRLALRDEKLAELVIVHELIHLLVPGHDRQFYKYLADCLPDWRERQNSLR